jgi:uncharacterized membrane protein
VATFVRIGPVPINLTLVPIVIGAAVFGVKAGAFLGFMFALVVVVMGISGQAPFGHALFLISPAAMVLSFLARGILAGTVAGLVYKLLSEKNRYLAVVCAAIATPITNTGLFFATMFLLFNNRLAELATERGASVVYFLFIILAGTNFLIEMGINILLSPTIKRIIDVRKKAVA